MRIRVKPSFQFLFSVFCWKTERESEREREWEERKLAFELCAGASKHGSHVVLGSSRAHSILPGQERAYLEMGLPVRTLYRSTPPLEQEARLALAIVQCEYQHSCHIGTLSHGILGRNPTQWWRTEVLEPGSTEKNPSYVPYLRWSWTSDLMFLGLSFYFFRMKAVIVSISYINARVKWDMGLRF
jgi:hypothetical protein